MIEELQRLRVERKLGSLLVKKEVNCVAVEAKRERLEQRDIVGHDLFVFKVESERMLLHLGRFEDNEPMRDYVVNVIIRQQIVQ